jgi:hypothetical protein
MTTASETSDKPPLNLPLSEPDKDKILAGATHIAIEVTQRDGEAAYGNVLAVGSEEECEVATMPPGFVVVPDGVKYIGQYIWETGEIREMIAAERQPPLFPNP